LHIDTIRKDIPSEYLGLMQLPLLARLSGLEVLRTNIDECIKLYGLSGDHITIIPKHDGCKRVLYAKTPLKGILTKTPWKPRTIVNELLKFYMYLGLLKKGNSTLLVNAVPWTNVYVKDKECFLLPPSSIYDFNYIHPVIEKGSLLTISKEYTINGMTVKSDKVYALNGDKLFVMGNNISIQYDHEYYNVNVFFQQPFCIVNSIYSNVEVESQFICIALNSKVISLASSNPVKVHIKPGSLIVKGYGELYVELSKNSIPLAKVLGITWSLINKPTILKNYRSVVKTIKLLELRPYDVLIYKVKAKAQDMEVDAFFHLINFSNEFRLIEMYIPAKIIKSLLYSLDYRLIEELEPEYNIIRIPLSPWSYRILELKLRRLPELLLKSLERQKTRI